MNRLAYVIYDGTKYETTYALIQYIRFYELNYC